MLTFCLFDCYRGGDLGSDPDILKLVQEQMQQWTNLMHKQRKEEWEMLKTHIKSQEDTFKKLCIGVQAKQLKDLEVNFTKLVFWRLVRWVEKGETYSSSPRIFSEVKGRSAAVIKHVHNI